MEDALHHIFVIARESPESGPADETLNHIARVAEDALIKQHQRHERLRRMTREAQEAGLYDE